MESRNKYGYSFGNELFVKSENDGILSVVVIFSFMDKKSGFVISSSRLDGRTKTLRLTKRQHLRFRAQNTG